MKTITIQRAAGGGFGTIDIQIVADIRESVSNLAANLGSGRITAIYDVKGTGINEAKKLGIPMTIEAAGSVADILNVTEADGSTNVWFSDDAESAAFAGY